MMVGEKVADNLWLVGPMEACRLVERVIGNLKVVRLVKACRLA